MRLLEVILKKTHTAKCFIIELDWPRISQDMGNLSNQIIDLESILRKSEYSYICRREIWHKLSCDNSWDNRVMKELLKLRSYAAENLRYR